MGENEESNLSNELSYWKSRCLAMEQKIDRHIEETSSPSKEDDSKRKSLMLKDEVKAIKNGMIEMEKRMNSSLQSLSEQFSIADQYSRSNSILIGGYKWLPKISGYDFIKATANEINCLFPSLNGSVRPIHIDDAHPLPTRRNKNKFVIIKFSNRWVKHEVLKRQGELKGSGLTVTEHLTPYTLQLLSHARNIVGEKNVWTYNTIVYAQHKGIRHRIQTSKDLDLLNEANIETLPMNKTTTITSNNNNASVIHNSATVHSQVVTDAPINHNNMNVLHENNYPSLYDSLLYNNITITPSSSRNNSTLRGMPSRNGRGRGGDYRRGGY